MDSPDRQEENLENNEISQEVWAEFNSLVYGTGKARLIYTLLGEAKGDDIFLYPRTEVDQQGKESVVHPTLEQASGIAKVLRQLGLFTDVRLRQNGSEAGFRVSYAKNAKDLRQLIDVDNLRSKDPIAYDKFLGEFYGFPESAVKAYPNGLIPVDQLPPAITSHPFFHNLLPFRLSRENYQQEWTDFVSKIKSAQTNFPEITDQLQLARLLNRG